MVGRPRAAFSLSHNGNSAVGYRLLDIIVTVDFESRYREEKGVLLNQAGIIIDILDNDITVAAELSLRDVFYEFFKSDFELLIRAGIAADKPSRLSLFRRA